MLAFFSALLNSLSTCLERRWNPNCQTFIWSTLCFWRMRASLRKLNKNLSKLENPKRLCSCEFSLVNETQVKWSEVIWILIFPARVLISMLLFRFKCGIKSYHPIRKSKLTWKLLMFSCEVTCQVNWSRPWTPFTAQWRIIRNYIISQIILAFWLGISYGHHLLEERRIDFFLIV